MKDSSTKRYRFGIFAATLEDQYHRTIYDSVQEALLQYPFDAFFFVGRELCTIDSEVAAHNFIYDFATHPTLDGIILITSPLSCAADKETFYTFLQKHSEIPLISFDHSKPDIPHVSIDGYSARFELVEHFINEHGKKQIAFLHSKTYQAHEQEKLLPFLDALKLHNIQLDERLLVRCTHSLHAAEEAIAALLDDTKIEFDAVIASNDELAMGAFTELTRRGINIPNEMIVGSFNDSEKFHYLDPPITGVNLPIQKQLFSAIRSLIDMVSNYMRPKLIIPSQLIIRGSCGCVSQPIQQYSLEKEQHCSVDEIIPEIIRDITKAKDISPEIESVFIVGVYTLVSALIKDMDADSRGGNEYSFEKIVESIIKEQLSKIETFHSVQKILSIIENHMLSMYSEKNAICKVADIFQKTLISASAHIKIRTLRRNQKLIPFFLDTMEIYKTLIPDEDFSLLSRRILTSLKILGIKRAVVMLFSKKNNLDTAYTMLSFNNDEVKSESRDDKQESKELLSSILSQSMGGITIAMPLVHILDRYGILLCESNPKTNLAIYENLRFQISNAIKGTDLFQESRMALRRQNILLEKLRSRTETLEKKLDELTQAKVELIEKEKSASLGNLVAGIAHEINTPLGICITSTSHINERCRKLSAAYTNSTMTKSDFEAYLALLEDTTDIITQNLNKSVTIISSFKQLAVDQASQEVRNFKVKDCLQDMLVSMHPVIKKTGHKIRLSCPDTIIALTYPGALSKSIAELIKNSLLHAYEENEGGQITITVSSKEGVITLSYTDDGIGIEEELTKKVFEPFYTTRRSDKMLGLGLSIVHSLVSSKLQGKIYCHFDSEKQKTEFVIEFPDHLP